MKIICYKCKILIFETKKGFYASTDRPKLVSCQACGGSETCITLHPRTSIYPLQCSCQCHPEESQAKSIDDEIEVACKDCHETALEQLQASNNYE